MNVLFISNDPSIFDSKSAVRARLRAYAREIGTLHVLSPAPAGAREESEEGLMLHPVHTWRIFRVRALTSAARRLIEKHHIEVVSAQDPFEHGLAALQATRGTGAKLHLQVHTDFLSPWFVRSGNWRSPSVRMPLLNRYRRRLANYVLPQADGIRAVSLRVKESLVATYGNAIAEPSIIPADAAVETVDPVPLPPHPFTFALITVGRLEPEKRIEDILAALKLVCAHYKTVGLFIVGEGRERGRLRRMVRTLGLENHVIFLGQRSDARGLMRSAQAFIQASAYEGYGFTLLEAALAKVPIITTDVGLVGEVFKGYEDVLSVPVADPTALSLAIVGLVEDMHVRLELPMHAETAAHAHLASRGNIPSRIMEDLSRIV